MTPPNNLYDRVPSPAGPPVAAPIRTPDQRLRVFISSTLGELAPERDAAQTAVRTLRLHPVMFELGARPHAPRDLYRSYLAQSDIFMGIYWQSYGWVAPEMTVSGIHDEYLLSNGRPKLIYVKEPAPDRQPELEAMLDQIRGDGGVAYTRFESPGELAELLLDDLAVLMSERFAAANRPALPSGTMTFMFSDIEGSTQLIEKIDGAYVDVLGNYQRLIEGAVRARGGVVVDREGDGVFSAFPEPTQAVEAAVEVQRSLALAPVAQGVNINARIGLHTGRATPNGNGYVGLDVHRAARIGAAGHGGQIVLSATTYQLVADSLPSHQWHARDLGAYALKGLSRAEHLYQLEALGLRSDFAGVRARKAVEARLPQQLTSLVARDSEIKQVAAILHRPDARLLTLTGTGGIGKTRLALAVAQQVADAYPDGVFFVSLAGVIDSRQVLIAIAEETNTTIGSSPLESLADALGSRQLLLVLDNFEQVVGAAADITGLLGRSPGLNVLVTSRVALRVLGEHEFQVEPLAVPAEVTSLSDVTAAAAVQLFEERARAIRPDFEVTTDNARSVATIVRRLDGLPLAIELAAARLRMLSPQALAEHLVRSFEVLGQGPQDLPARQRTLRSTIDWSYALLTEEEKQAFRHLALLEDGWDLEAGSAVAGNQAVWLIESLIDKSLVRLIADEWGDSRFRMLATVREYGRDQLQSTGENQEARSRRDRHYLEVATRAASGLQSTRQGSTMRALDHDWENIRATAEGLIDVGDFENLIRLAHSLWIYLWLRGHVPATSEWLAPLLARERFLADDMQGLLLWLLAGGSFEAGDYQQALNWLDESVALLTAAGDVEGTVWARYVRASTLPAFGVDDDELLAELNALLAQFQAMTSKWGQAWVRTNLAMLFSCRGDWAGALEHTIECLNLAESMENKSMIAQAHATLGVIYVAMGNLEEARSSLVRSLDIHRTITYREGLTYALDGLASLALSQGEGNRAMTAIGAAEGLRSRLGFRPWPAMRWYLDMTLAMVDAVTDPEMQASRVAGREMDPLAAATIALG
ncbi:MAG TPA: DUF4062 domain-containing protein [Acidimicrobiia bacterium]|nr:DUF4062 domain-containing protein [Acidimicrobiia bacterium]